MFLGKYYFTTPRIKKLSTEEKQKIINRRTVYINDLNKSQLEDFLQKELNTPMNIFEDIFKIYIIKYNNNIKDLISPKKDYSSDNLNLNYNLSIFIKSDHVFCDGLAFVSLIGHLDDNFDINKYPSIMKKKISFFDNLIILIPYLLKIFTFGIFEFIYYFYFISKLYKGFNNKKILNNTVITTPWFIILIE